MNSMRKILTQPFFFVILFFNLAFAQDNFLKFYCLNNGNFTRNSTYQTNLNRSLSNLLSNTAASGFFTASIGESPDNVTATSLCRGDALPETCRQCVNDSITKLPQLCPLSKGAIGWYDNCMLKFSKDSIDEDSPFFTMDSPHTLSSTINGYQYNQTLRDLIIKLKTQAAKGGPHQKYATGVANVTFFQSIYGLVQCTPELSEQSCSNCLERATNEIQNCCAGKDGGRVLRPSCNLRYESNQFYTSTTPDATPSGKTGGGGHTTRTMIISVVSVASLILLILNLRKKNPCRKLEVENEEIISMESLQYDFDTIRIATDNFSLANKLGQGGFGAVYKGILPDGQEIAVKRLSMGSAQGDLEFKNEVMLVAKLQHRNLVRLMGFSLLGSERLLIYEFLPKTSLDHFIFDPIKSSKLNWESRYKIIGGIARGLLYLHEDSRLRVIHRDLKASNILLDADMNPKISDFGIARLFIVDQTHGDTNRIVGTFGYMAPEYVLYGHFSFKSDVFSFGILILEIVSGQKNTCFLDGELQVLVNNAWENWRAGTPLKLMDVALSSGSTREIVRCIHIALLCVQECVADRPNMASVVLMLSSDSLTLPVPSRPPFMNSSVQNMHSGQGDSVAPNLTTYQSR